jgi:hypothetical protein
VSFLQDLDEMHHMLTLDDLLGIESEMLELISQHLGHTSGLQALSELNPGVDFMKPFRPKCTDKI